MVSKVIELQFIAFSQFFLYFLSLRSRHLPQHFILKFLIAFFGYFLGY